MKNNTIVLTSESTAIASKSFLKKAMVFGTDEYYTLKGFKSENPTVKVTAREIKKNPNKESYKNLTYDNMVAYIGELANKNELLAEFERQKRMASIAKNKYRYVLNWFKSACFESDIEFNKFRSEIALGTVVSSETNDKALYA